MSNLAQLRVEYMVALQANDDVNVERLELAIESERKLEAKAKADALVAEAKALQGVRDGLQGKILDAMGGITIDSLKLSKVLKDVKATGFTLRLPDDQSDKSRVVLTVSGMPKAKGTGGGGGAGKSVDRHGMTLDEIYNKYKTPEDDAKLAEADKLDAKPRNSAQWKIRDNVRLKAIKDGLLAVNGS